MSSETVKSGKKKYKFKDDAIDILSKYSNDNKKTKKKTITPPNNNPLPIPTITKQHQLPQQRPSSPTQQPKKKQSPIIKRKLSPQEYKYLIHQKELQKQREAQELHQNKEENTSKSITIDLNYSIDGSKSPSKRKVKEIERFFDSKTTKYQPKRNEESYDSSRDTMQTMLNKDKEIRKVQDNIANISVAKINQMYQQNLRRSPQRSHMERLAKLKQLELEKKKIEENRRRTMTNKKYYSNLVDQIKKREMENNKLKEELIRFRQGKVQPEVKSDSILILERKREELINQQRKELERIKKNKSDLQKIITRKKEIQLLKSIEEEKKKLVQLKLEQEKLAKLQYDKELNELKNISKEKIVSFPINLTKNVKIGSSQRSEEKNEKKNQIDEEKNHEDKNKSENELTFDAREKKNKTKKRVRFNLENTKFDKGSKTKNKPLELKDSIIKPLEVELELEPVIKPKEERIEFKEQINSQKKLKVHKNKAKTILFSKDCEPEPEYVYYCGIKVFNFGVYGDRDESAKKLSSKDMMKSVSHNYNIKKLKKIASLPDKKIDIISILYNILTSTDISLTKKIRY